MLLAAVSLMRDRNRLGTAPLPPIVNALVLVGGGTGGFLLGGTLAEALFEGAIGSTIAWVAPRYLGAAIGVR